MTPVPSYMDLKENKVYCSYHTAYHTKYLRIFKVTGEPYPNDMDVHETHIPVYEYTEVVSRNCRLEFAFGYDEGYYIDHLIPKEHETCYWELTDEEIHKHVIMETI